MVDLEDLQNRIKNLPPTELRGNPTKEYVSLGRLGYGTAAKKPKFDPSAGRDYDADAALDPEDIKALTPISPTGQRR
jgi:hypothetical protein